MKCKHHPTARLDEVTIKTQQIVPWSDEPIHTFQDVQFCTQCWTEHENGKPIKHELIMTEEDYLEQQIDNYNQRRI